MNTNPKTLGIIETTDPLTSIKRKAGKAISSLNATPSIETIRTSSVIDAPYYLAASLVMRIKQIS